MTFLMSFPLFLFLNKIDLSFGSLATLRRNKQNGPITDIKYVEYALQFFFKEENHRKNLQLKVKGLTTQTRYCFFY